MLAFSGERHFDPSGACEIQLANPGKQESGRHRRSLLLPARFRSLGRLCRSVEKRQRSTPCRALSQGNESSREPAPGWPPGQTPATVPQQERSPGRVALLLPGDPAVSRRMPATAPIRQSRQSRTRPSRRPLCRAEAPDQAPDDVGSRRRTSPSRPVLPLPRHVRQRCWGAKRRGPCAAWRTRAVPVCGRRLRLRVRASATVALPT
jgi:hypothetical protein